MSFLSNIFNKKDQPIKSSEDFWNWFQKNEANFHRVVKEKGNIEKDFFNELSPKISQLREGFFYLTGMVNPETVELVITADGNLKNIAFVEDLIKSSPTIEGWIFTALKSPMDIKNMSIQMGGYDFKSENISFYSNEDPNVPDEIDITVVHHELNEANKSAITNGTFIFLDNYLGELAFATTVDAMNIVSKSEAAKELVPIEKLKDFLIWREKEFVEKYDGLRQNTDDDTYATLEAKLESGNPMIAIINNDLLKWDSKASHPWILEVSIKYEGSENNGMPNADDYSLMNEIEDEILKELKDVDGYLNIGRETVEGVREIYFACIDFRKPSKVLDFICRNYNNEIDVNFDIYKDKYWRSFDRFLLN